MSIKQAIVGTPLGRFLMDARHQYTFHRAVATELEKVGMLANDSLATTLVVGLCPPSGVFLDIGGHLGSVTADVLHSHPNAQVMVIEAIPEKADALSKKFPSTTVFSCAVADREGRATFYIDTKKSGYSSLRDPRTGRSSEVTRIEVDVRTLDSLLPKTTVDVLKIDVEGAELAAFQGGVKLLERSRPLIMFESAPEIERDDAKRAMWTWLRDHNFDVYLPNRLAHTAPAMTEDGFVESHYYPRRTTNFFAVPPENRGAVRDAARRILAI